MLTPVPVAWIVETLVALWAVFGQSHSPTASTVVQTFTSLLAATACTTLRARTPAHYRTAANYMLAATWVWNLADLGWLALGHSAIDGISLDVAAGLYLLSTAAMVVAAVYVAGRGQRFSSNRAIIDGLLVGLVVAFVSWANTPAITEITLFGQLYAIALVVADGMLLTGWIVVMMNGRLTNFRAAGGLIASSALLLVCDSVYVHSKLTDSDLADSGLFWGWSAVSLLRALALFSIAYDRPRIDRLVPVWGQRVVPAIAIGGGMIAMLFATDGRSALNLALAGAIIGTVIVRQIMVEVEQRTLARKVEITSAALLRRAERDDLTGLYLRDALFRRAQEAIHRSTGDRSELALIFIDIDGFKIVNDRFGHSVGDQMLVSLARRLERSATADDTVARVGGDEFVILRVQADAAAHLGADEWAERVRQSLSEPVLVGNVPMRLTASVGLVVSNRPGTTVDELLSHADQAALRAKTGGRNQTARFDLPTEPDAPHLAEVSSVVAALTNGELEAWYQPIVELGTGRVIGAEALVRWIHPDGRVRSAGEFVLDLIVAGRGAELTDIILTQACRDFATGPAAQWGWSVSVNLSAAELSDPGVIDRIEQAILSSGIDPGRLQIEIDERTSPTGPTSRVLEAIDRLGVSLAVDDFGASNSTFGQLAKLAPTTLKLDRTLVDPHGPDTLPTRRHQPCPDPQQVLRSPDLIQAFTQLAHHVSMKVVVEGVETVQQLEALAALGCDQGQGFLWSKAVPASEFFALAAPGRIDAAPGRVDAAPGKVDAAPGIGADRYAEPV